MRNISDLIEQYLKHILNQNEHNSVDIQRSEIADQFNCVPSQINYVISTRFTIEKGYIVESKRGGGGYIRIRKVLMKQGSLIEQVLSLIGDEISQAAGEGLIHRLQDAQLITEREARIMGAAISRDVLVLQMSVRDQVRAKMMRLMLTKIL